MLLRRSDLIRKSLFFTVILGSSLLIYLSPTQAEEEATLYKRLGGLAPISVVVSDFIDQMIPDKELNKNPAINAARARVPAPYLKYHVTAMVCNVTGGPCEYKGRDMKASHQHLNISSTDWDRMVEIFKGVLDQHKVPKKEQDDLLAIVGTTKADIVKQPGKAG